MLTTDETKGKSEEENEVG